MSNDLEMQRQENDEEKTFIETEKDNRVKITFIETEKEISATNTLTEKEERTKKGEIKWKELEKICVHHSEYSQTS